jgi:hypothetical protein
LEFRTTFLRNVASATRNFRKMCGADLGALHINANWTAIAKFDGEFAEPHAG